MTSVASRATVAAQAKLNLFLRVLAREDSGYHQVETLLCRVALSDSIRIAPTPGPRSLDVAAEGVRAESLGPVEDNLAWRAAVAYAEATGFPAGFEIQLIKRIPVGAGLGGGSADAGAVLRALNALNPGPLAPEALLRLATPLGADVPFLTQDRSPLAMGWGRGERLLFLPPLPASAAWLLVPGVGVNTGDAYRWLDEAPLRPPAKAYAIDRLSTWAAVAEQAGNAFEGAVASRVPVVRSLLSVLRSEPVAELLGPGALVFMTGSGSTIAVLAGTRPERDLGTPPPVEGVTIIETETATFVEPVVLTH